REFAVILRTPRLVLREFTAEDWTATHAYQQDPRYLRYYDRAGVTEREAQAFIYTFILWQGEQPRTRAQLAITIARTGELIGNVGLRRDHPDDRMADMGYELSPTHWGRGFATEAARAMVNLGFGAWGLHRIHAHCVAENEASARVLTRVGLRQEARLRDHQFFKDRFWDVTIFGMMRDEWTPADDHGRAG
ncbi:MAG TPA: GNAT family protein, partial [Longimicrobium sp.]|nr:GNAT family protein [Longimicrobium sp.]